MAPLQAMEGRSRVSVETNSTAPFAYHSRMAAPSPDRRPASDQAVILARGLGSRMRKPVAGAALDPAQHAAAERGQKAMMPLAGGRPFLDFVLSGLGDAGYGRVRLVVGPDRKSTRL